MDTALRWISELDRQDMTWTDVSDSCGFDKSTLLFAYPDKLPDLAERRAASCALPRKVLWSRNGTRVRPQCDGAFAGAGQIGPWHAGPSVVLLKADTCAQSCCAAVNTQSKGSLPPLTNGKRRPRTSPPSSSGSSRRCGETCWRTPVPFPAEVVRCVNTAWQRSAAHAEQVPGIDIGSGLTLLLETGPTLREVAVRALREGLANAGALVLALGQAHRLGRVHAMPGQYRKQALLIPSVLGLLLAKTNSFKGDYMHDTPYWVGRLMSLADRLHRNYCEREREGKMPPQLLGNALMATVLENPVAGLHDCPSAYRCTTDARHCSSHRARPDRTRD